MTTTPSLSSIRQTGLQTKRRELAETTARLMEQTISYVESPEYQTVCRENLLDESILKTDPAAPQTVAPADTPPYLASLYSFPLLTREQEFVIFRKMNFLLFEAAQLQRKLSLRNRNSRKVQAICSRLQGAKEIRNRIVQSNLRLVVSIAKTLVDSANSLEELISEGNLPLIRAVEIFDFTRGLRFSTYATWAIRNGLFRASHRNRRRQARFHPEDLEQLSLPEIDRDASLEELTIDRSSMDQLIRQLEPRCQTIIQQRFGLSGQTRPAKFRELANQLQLSAERVRQLLERSLGQLRELSVR